MFSASFGETAAISAVAVAAIIIVVMFVMVIMAAAVAMYILNALGLQTLAKKRNISNSWLAWIPVANAYLLGCIVPSVNIGSWKIKNLKMWLPILVGVTAVISSISSAVNGVVTGLGLHATTPGIAMVAVMAILFNMFFVIALAGIVVFEYIVYFRLFRQYRPEKSVLYLVLSIIFPFLLPIFIFSIRNETLKCELEEA